jgi:RNA polymerase sigma factor (sigma-70 family)
MSPRLSDLLLRSQSDERLVSLAAAGHDRAFGTIVERYRPELLAMARRLVSDGRAEDVLQQALLSAFAALRSGTEVRHVRGWLYQIVRNAAVKTRPPAESPLDELTASGPALEEVVQERELAMSAMTEISRLPERQRAALVGSAFGGLGRAELAASMGLSEGAVRQLVHRARATVRGAVTAVTPWPLANWLAAMPGGAGGTSEVVAAAGAVSGGGLAVKLGALLVTGAVATGVVVAPRDHHPRAQTSRAASTTVPARTSTHAVASGISPVAAVRGVASAGSGERHGGEGGGSRGGGRGDSNGGSRRTGDGRGSRRGESDGSRVERGDDSRSRGGPSADTSGSDDHAAATQTSTRADRGGTEGSSGGSSDGGRGSADAGRGSSGGEGGLSDGGGGSSGGGGGSSDGGGGSSGGSSGGGGGSSGASSGGGDGSGH